MAAARARDSFYIKSFGNGSRAYACHIFFENAADDVGLIFNNFTLAAADFASRVHLVDRAIAVTNAGRSQSIFQTPALATPDFCGNILQEQSVHRAFQTDMKL
ncbi:MAG: hypothetical protein FWF24_04755 [Alphaproteobacteria bacterium]|nr:hypothetical protein [Alphaproteobacteria bacterium]